jgi:hypothetical protein
VQQGGLQDRGEGQLQVAGGDSGQPVLVRDHLALLGDLDRAVDRAERLGHDRLMGGTSTPSDGPTPTVEEAQGDAVLVGDVTQHPLGLVDLPLRGGDTAGLVGVRIAEHHLLEIAPQFHQPPVGLDRQQRLQHFPGVAQVGDRLHQGTN